MFWKELWKANAIIRNTHTSWVLDYSLYLVVTLPSRMVRLLLDWFSLNNSNFPNILGRIFTQWYSGQHYLNCERKGHNVQVALRPYSRSWLIMKLLHNYLHNKESSHFKERRFPHLHITIWLTTWITFCAIFLMVCKSKGDMHIPVIPGLSRFISL